MEFFDCNVQLGPVSSPPPVLAPYECEEVVDQLTEAGITTALVYHSWAKGWAAARGNERLLEEMVIRAGAQHVLFGTDMPLLGGRAQVGRILTARLTDDEKRLILGLNAARIFDLPVHFTAAQGACGAVCGARPATKGGTVASSKAIWRASYLTWLGI